MTASRSGEVFFTVMPLPNDFVGQLGLGKALPVLRLDLCDIDIGADLEREPHRHVPIVRAGGIVIQEVIDAGELHLDRARHGFGDDFRARPGIIGIDLHHGRRDLRKLRDGQSMQRDQAHHHNDDGQDGGKNGAINKKMRAHASYRPYRSHACLYSRFFSPVLSEEAGFTLIMDRIYLGSRLDSMKSFHNHSLSRTKTALDQPFVPMPSAGVNRPKLRFVTHYRLHRQMIP